MLQPTNGAISTTIVSYNDGRSNYTLVGCIYAGKILLVFPYHVIVVIKFRGFISTRGVHIIAYCISCVISEGAGQWKGSSLLSKFICMHVYNIV